MKNKNYKSIQLVTPENIVLNMLLPTEMDRFDAFLRDFLRLLFITVLLIVLTLVISNILGGVIAGIVFTLCHFFLWGGYFIYYELKYSATPGKRSMGFKVVSRNGSFLPPSAIYVRNIIREIELWLPLKLLFVIYFSPGNAFSGTGLWPFLWVIVFLGYPLVDKHNRRIGDILAGTIVVAIPKAKLEKDLAKKKQSEEQLRYSFTEQMLDIYGKEELQTLEEILRKSPEMQLRERNDLFGTLVHKITRKIGYQEKVPPREHQDFLQEFYKVQRGYLEKKLLHGRSLTRKTKRWIKGKNR